MRNYFAFLKKEWLESARTYKLLIMLIVFFIFGLLSPLTAKLLPEIMSSVMTDGIIINLPEPAAIDSWTQFFKNISQMGLFVIVILFSGILSTELSKGTLVNMLTKGLSRSTVILSKFSSMATLWTISYILAFIVALGYTVYLFPDDAISNLLFSVFCLWLFGIFLLASLMFASTLVKSNYGCLLITGALLVVLIIFNMIPGLQKFNPLSLATNNIALLTNEAEIYQLLFAVVISITCSLLLIMASVIVFRKRQL
jgi:ABC-2 type transport system permease protein